VGGRQTFKGCRGSEGEERIKVFGKSKAESRKAVNPSREQAGADAEDTERH